MRRALVVSGLALTLAVGAAVQAGAHAVRVDPGAGADPAAGVDPAIVTAYASVFPGVPPGELAKRAVQESVRDELLDRFVREYDEEFTGSRHDVAAGVWHLYVTTPDAAESMAALAAARGVRTETHLVRYSYQALAAKAQQIRSGKHTLSAVAGQRIGIDAERNKVVVAVPARIAASAARVDPAVVLEPITGPAPTPAACVSRRDCGIPLRGGVILWRGARPSPLCSLGFTATAADRSRWALTAGHCSDRNDEIWGHGDQVIGPVRQQFDPGNSVAPNVDVARIRIDSSYWRSAPGGFMYSTPAAPVEVDGAITDPRQIAAGQVVCYTGWHAVANRNCGTIVDSSSPLWFGMPEVNPIDVCRGDSGGSVYRLTAQGRIAVGLVSAIRLTAGDGDCGIRSSMWFSPMPSIMAAFNRNPDTGMRVDVR